MESAVTNSNLESNEPNIPAVTNNPATELTPIPIAEFAARNDFPECARGQFVDIGGYAGTVTDIVSNSLKVRSPEGVTRSFNFNTLKKLYGPRVEVEAMPSYYQPKPSEPEPEAELPKRVVIESPNFDAPVKLINQFTGAADFPKCALGEHVEIAGYTGVVVEIVNRSLKVRSREETTRSFNADVLRKLHPPRK